MKADNDNVLPGAVYTLDEAASHLRLTNRGVAKIARRHGLCMVNGRNLLLTGRDIEAIKDTLRCPSSYNSAGKPGGSVAPSLGAAYMSLQAATTKKSRRRSV